MKRLVKCFAFLTFTLFSIGCTNEISKSTKTIDEEAYIPRHGFEQETTEAAEQPSIDEEAYIPLQDFEEWTSEENDEEELSFFKDEKPDSVTRINEAYHEIPGFEDSIGKSAEQLEKDIEAFTYVTDYEESKELFVEGKLQIRQLKDYEQGINIKLNQKSLTTRVVIQGNAKITQDGICEILGEKQQNLTFNTRIPLSMADRNILTSQPIKAKAYRVVRPNGIAEAISISADNQLSYLSEVAFDKSLLSSDMSFGLTVNQITKSLKSPIYSGPDRYVYEVPVKIRLGESELELSAGEQGEIGNNSLNFKVNILISQFSVPKDSPYEFEGPRRHLEYVIWRE